MAELLTVDAAHENDPRLEQQRGTRPSPNLVTIVGDGWSMHWPQRGLDQVAAGREYLRVRFRRHLVGILSALASAPSDEEAAHAARLGWSLLTAEALAAYELHPLVAEVLEHPVPLGRARLDQCHAVGLASLSSAISEGGRPLGELLTRYITDGLVSTETARALDRYRAAVERPEEPPARRWGLAAVVSAATAAAGLEDPHPIDTANAYVAFCYSQLTGRAPRLPQLHPDQELLNRIVSDDGLADAAARLFAGGSDYRRRAEHILHEAGRAHLVDRAQAQADVLWEEELQRRLAHLYAQRAAEPSAVAAAQAMAVLLDGLRDRSRDADIVRAGRHALASGIDQPQLRATLLTVIGAALKDARRPADYLALLDEQPAGWEIGLPPPARIRLTVERSNALRLEGHVELALAALLNIDPSDRHTLGPQEQRALRRNIALLRRQAGDPGTALRELTLLLAETKADDERFDMLDSLAYTAQFLGNAHLALPYFKQALDLATGPKAEHRARLTTSMATIQAALGQPMADLGPVLANSKDPLTVIAVGAAAASALEHNPAAVPPDLITQILARLTDIASTAARNIDKMVELNALRAKAVILDTVDPDIAAAVWIDLVSRRGLDRPDPLELAALAHHEFRSKRPEPARDLLARVPDALATELGGTTDIAEVVDATGRLQAKFRLLGDDVLAADPPHLPDIRLVAELQRDALGQIRARARGEKDATSGTTATSTRILALPHHQLWVLEWLDTTPGILGLLSRMDPTGRSTVKPLPPVDIDPVRLVKALHHRLNTWSTKNSRDPFDLPEWRRAEHWFRTAMADAQPGDHLVVIEHEAASGLPWHSLEDVPWTTSYAASWTAMVRARALPQRDLQRVGHISVPAVDDSTIVTSAFDKARRRTQNWCVEHHHPYAAVSGADADKAAVLQLFQRCDIATVHCHGLYQPGLRDITLMLAHEGRLPPQTALAAKDAPEHQLSWRNLQHLDKSPALVLSAACSSGRSVVAGLGERLGLYGALRHSGTRAVIAPAWDAIPTDVPGQLDDVRERILAGEGVARAIKNVADSAAAAGLPSWRARILALDGDWT